MTIDWTAPCETDEDPPRPVRVLATDLAGTYPVAISIERPYAAGVKLHLINWDGSDPYSNVRIRNAKPKPVLHERWVNLTADGGLCGPYPTQQTADRYANMMTTPRIECRRTAWMSDGSPVPGGEYLSLKAAELEAERDALNSQLAEAREEITALQQVVDEAVDERGALRTLLEDWRPPANKLHQTQVALETAVEERKELAVSLASMTNDFDALKAHLAVAKADAEQGWESARVIQEVRREIVLERNAFKAALERMRKNYEEAADIASQHAAEVDRMRPVVEAAGIVFQKNGSTEALWHALRAYREGGGDG